MYGDPRPRAGFGLNGQAVAQLDRRLPGQIEPLPVDLAGCSQPLAPAKPRPNTRPISSGAMPMPVSAIVSRREISTSLAAQTLFAFTLPLLV
ncbi:hypothetical protein COLU111180_11815 [Cohnella lubricantis]|uniref:Uncharacterized protein n=1 Tax=Cohnella lubricantis TaxID=2163172 RepID=A0A841T5J0_9BACL|nr:hypothetical protein [Cohnella lubricantis]MBB6676132.1 hypothetical protein [Cohnella lubricantis]MBP2118676.1 hypothetical protein [Cohnella lubricantis]